MKIKDVKKLTAFERLTYFITERESIRIARKNKKPAPWTDDERLQTYRFCNVRRMDDKVSQWLLKHWYAPHKNNPNMVVAATIARHFNLPSCLQHLTKFVFGEYQPDKIKETVRKLKASGQTVFNGAYMVRGMAKKEPHWTPCKGDQVLDRVCQPMVETPPIVDTSSMETSVEALLPYWGFSTFMAGQVVADLRWALTGTWADRHDWAPIGPGSKRGINRLQERLLDQPLQQEEFLAELTEMMTNLKTVLPTSITGRLEAQDYQSCLCEFDKSERVLWGEGVPKQLYRGGRG